MANYWSRPGEPIPPASQVSLQSRFDRPPPLAHFPHILVMRPVFTPLTQPGKCLVHDFIGGDFVHQGRGHGNILAECPIKGPFLERQGGMPPAGCEMVPRTLCPRFLRCHDSCGVVAFDATLPPASTAAGDRLRRPHESRDVSPPWQSKRRSWSLRPYSMPLELTHSTLGCLAIRNARLYFQRRGKSAYFNSRKMVSHLEGLSYRGPAMAGGVWFGF